jgi:hypothetical protein
MLRKTVACIFCIGSVISGPSGAYADGPYLFQGRGIVSTTTKQGVPGETVDVRFTYSTSDFHLTTFDNLFSRWQVDEPIPLTVTGSISGDSFRLRPVQEVEMITWTRHYWGFETGTASATLGPFGRVDAPAMNSLLSTPQPRTFAEAHPTG